MIHSLIFRQLEQYVHFNPYNGSISKYFNKNSYIIILCTMGQGRIEKNRIFFKEKKCYNITLKAPIIQYKVLDISFMFTLSGNYFNIVKNKT
jgi:hypothetical protein